MNLKKTHDIQLKLVKIRKNEIIQKYGKSLQIKKKIIFQIQNIIVTWFVVLNLAKIFFVCKRIIKK